MPLAKHSGIVSGRLLVCLVAALWLSGPASAGCISQTFGNTTFHNCDGKLGTSQTFGNTTAHNVDGKLGTSQTFGNTTVHNIDGKPGASQTFGNTTMHNIDGKLGTSQTFGDTTVHNVDGELGTSQTFGNTLCIISTACWDRRRLSTRPLSRFFVGTLGPSQAISPTTVHNFDGALRTQALLVSLKERRLYIVPFFAHLRGGVE